MHRYPCDTKSQSEKSTTRRLTSGQGFAQAEDAVAIELKRRGAKNAKIVFDHLRSALSAPQRFGIESFYTPRGSE